MNSIIRKVQPFINYYKVINLITLTVSNAWSLHRLIITCHLHALPLVAVPGSYDVQTVSLRVTGNGVVATCSFLFGSSAQGCQMEFNCTRTGLVHSAYISKSEAEAVAMFTFTSLEECFYTVLVSDVESNGSVNPIPAITASAWLSASVNSPDITTGDIATTDSK